MRRGAFALLLVAPLGCGDIKGLGGSVPPLATMQVEATSDPGRPGEQLRIAMVWGMQWLPELLCSDLIPPEGSAGPVLDAGCRDPFGFVPLRVETNVPATIGAPTEVQLFDLPGADVLVGTLDARVGFASFVLYDDVDGDGNLGLARANRINGDGEGDGSDGMQGSNAPTVTRDVVLGASFLTMTAPDTRLAYREGAFIPSAFYPRSGCGAPPPSFSIDSAGGFSAQSAIAATLQGMLPPEDPATCSESALDAATVQIAPMAPSQALEELACTENTADSSVRYREPDTDSPDLTNRQIACVHVPTLGGSGSAMPQQIELIVTGRSDDSCVGLTHYVLKGCREDPNCEAPDWDHSLAPPTWWPCPSS